MDKKKKYGWGRFFLHLLILGGLIAGMYFALRLRQVSDWFVSRAIPALSESVGYVMGQASLPVSEICLSAMAVLFALTPVGISAW